MRKKVFIVQGMKFNLRPSSPVVRSELEALSEKQSKALMEFKEFLDEIEQAGDEDDLESVDKLIEEKHKELEIRDAWEHLYDCFCIITEGPHDKIDYDNFDLQIANEALENFNPLARRT